MTTYGLTATGLVIKTQDIIRSELAATVQGVFGASADVGNTSLLGQLLGIIAEREGQLWDLVQQVTTAQNPDAATGPLLDSLAALTGAFRTPASSSKVAETLTGTPTTVVPSGSQVKTASTGAVFATASSATLTALAAWAASTAYSVGQRRTNASRCYQVTVAGTSAASGGPTTNAGAITDNTVTWTYLGEGTGVADVAAASVNTGPIVAASGDLTVIQTPVGGWASARNLLDATPGTNLMTDAALRILRVASLSAGASATQNAIRAALLQLPGVTGATVFVNNTDITDASSLPPHSIEALVQGGADQDILNALFANVSAGIAYRGTISSTVVDSQGVNQTVKFSRPTGINVFVDITLVKDPATYPADGDARVKAAIAAYGATQAVGRDVVASNITAVVFPVYVSGTLVSGVPGVLDVPRSGAVGGTKIGQLANPTSDTTISITPRQLAVFDTSRITVHASNGTP